MDICVNNWYSRPKYSELACLWNPSSLPIAGSSVTIHVTETQNHGKVPVFGSFMVIFVDCNEIGCNICKARPTFGRCMLVFHKNNSFQEEIFCSVSLFDTKQDKKSYWYCDQQEYLQKYVS